MFVSTIDLSDDLFIYQNINDDEDEDQDNDESDDEEEIDLCVIEPRLSTFKDKVGTPGFFKFWTSVALASLTFEIGEPWWHEFLELWSQARKAIDDQRAAEIHELEAAEEQDNEIVLAKLRELIGDRQFVSLPTQRAMRAYAIEAIPELEEFTDEFIKSEIQAMTAKIQSRGLKRR